MGSFREIAMFMDPVVTKDTLRELASIHRWPNSEIPSEISFLEICERHGDSERQLKSLFYNTWLLRGVALETYCLSPFGKKRIRTSLVNIGEKPIRQTRAREIAQALVINGYDVVALAEVFDDEIRNIIVSAMEMVAGTVDVAVGPGPSGYKSVSFNSGWLRLIPIPLPGIQGILGASCPPLFIREIGADVENSGLVTLGINRSLNNRQVHRFQSKGEPLKDSDYWASKGILRVEINIGVGTIELYSVHLHAGGSLIIDPTSEETYAVRQNQFREIIEFVRENRDPRNVCVIMGDFNTNGMDLSDTQYDILTRIMESEGFEDLWANRATDELGEFNPRPTTLLRDEENLIWYGRDSCAVSDMGYCDDIVESLTTLGDNSPRRIDYIFVERQKREHSFLLDITRPRRIPFQRERITDGIEFLSDHIGLEVTFITNPI